jgi:Mg2+ and Co2+ transporter CorA
MANRKRQISLIQKKLEPVIEELETLIEELEEALENMPESFKDGNRGEAAQERIEMLGDWRDSLTDIVEAEE